MNIRRTYNPVEPGAPAIWLLGVIGDNVRVPPLLRDLREYPDGDGPIDIFVESGGGRHDVGMDVYSLLRDLRRPKRMTIIAARSMAATVAMAGDVIRIIEGGCIFLHRPHVSIDAAVAMAAEVELNAVALRDLASRCDDVEHVQGEIIARRTGQPRSFIAAMCAIETTLDAVTAVKLGFADEIVSLPQPQDAADARRL